MFTNDGLITEKCFMPVKEIIKFSLCLTALEMPVATVV